MKRRTFSTGVIPLAFFVVVLALTPAVQACSVCMGDPAAPTAKAMNAAIFIMLGCIGGVLGLLSVFAIYLYRRSLNPVPPHAEFTDDMQPQNGFL